MVFGQKTVYLNDCVINEIMIRDCSIELLFHDGLVIACDELSTVK